MDKRIAVRKILRQQLQVQENTLLLLFNGAFKYAPNRVALENLLNQVNPLLARKGLPYLVVILGLDIPETVKEAKYPGIKVLGFVEDLEHYLTGCQVFLNPVNSGGGIKTKLVEALAYGLDAVSSENGVIGVDPGICNGKLAVCADGDWKAFAEAVFRFKGVESETPAAFYDHFYWANITERAARFIVGQSKK
jgi:hypothetical protein